MNTDKFKNRITIIKRMKKFENRRHNMFSGEEMRRSLINSNQNLKKNYDRAKSIMKDFEAELITENVLEIIKYEPAREVDNSEVELIELETINTELQHLYDGIKKVSYSKVFDKEFFASEYFQSVVPGYNKPPQQKIKKIKL